MLTAALAGVARGEREALRELYRRTSAKLFGISVRICGDRQSAEDILQDVFITVWARAASFDPARASPITWLAAITRNKAIDWRRSNTKMSPAPVELLDAVADPAPQAFEAISGIQEGERLGGCLDELESRTSWAIRSAFLDGTTYAELAEKADVPLGTMKSLIRRGLQRLKICLDHV